MKENIKILLTASLLTYTVGAQALVSDVFDMMYSYHSVEKAKEEKRVVKNKTFEAIVLTNKACNIAVSKDLKKFNSAAAKTLPGLTTEEQKIKYAIIALSAKNTYQARRQACNKAAINKLQELQGN